MTLPSNDLPDPLTVLQNLYAGVMWVDHSFIVRWVNTQIEQQFYVSKTRIVGKNILDILHPIGSDNQVKKQPSISSFQNKTAATSAATNGGRFNETKNQDDTDDLPIEQQNKDTHLNKKFANAKSYQQPFIEYNRQIRGVTTPVCIDYSVTPIEQQGNTCFLVEVWDKHRQSRIDKDHQLQQQHEIAREMLRSVAHEVKNPLAGIRGAAQLLIKQTLKKSTPPSAPKSQDSSNTHSAKSTSNNHPIADSLLEGINNKSLHDKSSQHSVKTPKDMTLVDAKKLGTYANIVINETDRLSNLIGQLLGSNKLPNVHLLNIHQPIEHVLLLADTQHPNVRIVRDYDLSLPDLEADRDQLIQVFLNLVNNAHDAVVERSYALQNKSSDNLNSQNYKPTLTITTRVEHQYTIGSVTHRQVIKIGIQDNGAGIKPEMMDRIFFPMVSGRANGTGLGLALVQEMIHQHQGTIEVFSEPGKTQFWIYLPFKQKDLRTYK